MNVLQTADRFSVRARTDSVDTLLKSITTKHRRQFIPPKDSDVTLPCPRSLQGVSGFILQVELPCSVAGSVVCVCACVFVLVRIC